MGNKITFFLLCLYIFNIKWRGLENHERFIRKNKTKQNRKKYLRNKKLLGGGDHIQKEDDLNDKYTHYQVNVKQYEVDDNNKIINYNEKWIKTYPNDDNTIRELKEHFLNDPKFIVRGLNREKM